MKSSTTFVCWNRCWMTPRMADFEALCPQCGAFEYHIVLDSLPAVLHIPPRVVLRCVNCNQLFYRVNHRADAN